MARIRTTDESAPICLEEALKGRLESRLRRIDRIRAAPAPPDDESDEGATLQALMEKLTRLRLHASLLRGRLSS